MEQQTSEQGYLIVNVTTALGAIPIEGAAVTVTSPDGGDIILSVQTDSSGKTPKMALDAPARVLSEQPGNVKPFATYTITSEKEGYYTVTNLGVPIFSGITSIQPVAMMPLSESDSGSIYPRIGLVVDESGFNPL